MSIYIHLFHGCNDPAQDMDDWGFDGPVLGPFDAICGTYSAHLRCILNGDEAPELLYHEDMLAHDGKYYGDFEITTSDTPKEVHS